MNETAIYEPPSTVRRDGGPVIPDEVVWELRRSYNSGKSFRQLHDHFPEYGLSSIHRAVRGKGGYNGV